MTTDARRWLQWILPPGIFCACVLSLFLFRQYGAETARLMLELALAASLGVIVSLLFRRSANSVIPQLRPAEESRSGGSWNRDIFDSVTEGLLILQPDGKIAAANTAARQIFGILLEMIEGKSLLDLFPGNDEDPLTLIADQIEHADRAQIESTGRRDDGCKFDAVIRGMPISHLGRPALLVSVEDVTERRRAAEQRALLSRKVLGAQEEERARVSRDLHDGLGQIIAALNFEVAWLKNDLASSPGVPEEKFASAASLIDEAGRKLRRICRGLRPPLLDDLGLMPSIRQLVDEFEQHSSLDIDLELRLDEDRFPVPPTVALCAFRVLQEALTNVLRHSDARKVSVTIVREYQWLVLSIYDNGRGFDAGRAGGFPGVGIEGMRERARLVNGSLEIHSVPDQGTRVVLRTPVPRQAEEDKP